MKKAIIILLLIPTLSFGQDTTTVMETQAESWEQIRGGTAIVGLAYVTTTTSILMYLNDPFTNGSLRNMLIISAGIIIIGILWINKGISRLIRAINSPRRFAKSDQKK